MAELGSPVAEAPHGGWSILRLAKLPAIAGLAVLLFSSVVTDGIPALQWMWWMPRPLLAGGTTLWLVGCIGLHAICSRRGARDRREERRLLVWTLLSSVALLVAFFSAWGLPRARQADAFRLIHWNASQLHADFAGIAVDRLLELEPDAFIFTDTSPGLAQACHEAFAPRGFEAVSAGKFIVFSRMRVSKARALVASRGRFISRFRIETAFGPLDVEPIDLPSSTTLPKFQLLRSLGAEVGQVREQEQLDPPDAMCGDFNVPRGSASLDFLMPSSVEAFATAGTGWGGSFPQDWALLAIDLTLVRAPWVPVRSEIVDFGVGRHRVQVVDLVRDAPLQDAPLQDAPSRDAASRDGAANR